MKCGFVILNYNDYLETIRLITRISEYDSINQIVVVDNKSSNGSFEYLKKYSSPKINIIQTSSNDGYSSGNNFGIKYLLEKYDVDVVAISNPDVEFEEAFVIKLLDDFEKNKQMSVVTGVQFGLDGKMAVHAFWPNYTNSQYFAFKSFSLRCIYHIKKYSSDFYYAQEKLKRNDTLFQVGAVEGSLFFIRVEDLKKIGLFDENIAFYHEEDILAKKIHNIGKKICVDPTIKFVHYGAQTTKKEFSNIVKARHSFKSSIYFFNNYQSHNFILQIINYLLCWAIRIEDFFVWKVKKMIKK